MTSVTAQLCERIVSLKADSLSDAAREKVRQLVLDGIAVAVAGTVQERPPGILAAQVKEEGAHPTASVIGFGFKTTPARAAYVNGSSMHVLDYEPMWLPANHALSTTLPAALALAEPLGSNGEALALALVKGIEIQGWIRQASGQFEPKNLVFHPPGMVGPLSSAVAAAELLKLDVSELRHALGLAGSRCGSLLANAGTMTKSTHCGLAASLGLESAQLAARGFTSNDNILEDPRGYAAAFFQQFDAALLENFGPPYRLVTPSYAIKNFPSQFGTHFAISAALEVHRQVSSPAEIEHVYLRTPMMPYVDRAFPETGLDGKFSWQYTAACALLDGKVTMASFEDERRFSADMVNMLGKIELDMRDDMSGQFDEMTVYAKATLTGGHTIEGECLGPKGSWRGEPLAPGDHLEKVRECLGLKLEPEAIEQVIALGSHCDELDAEGLRELIALVR